MRQHPWIHFAYYTIILLAAFSIIGSFVNTHPRGAFAEIPTPNIDVFNQLGPTIETPTPAPAPVSGIAVTPLPGNLDEVVFIENGQTHTIRQLVPQDWIMPIYNPRFTNDSFAYNDDELVMGVEINGDARAYSVGVLQGREMVNDVVGGTPILVTW